MGYQHVCKSGVGGMGGVGGVSRIGDGCWVHGGRRLVSIGMGLGHRVSVRVGRLES